MSFAGIDRRVVVVVGIVVLIFTTAMISVGCSDDKSTTVPLPTMEGPIIEPGFIYIDILEQGFPLRAADCGYLVEEYFVSGTAAGEPYKTRILVRHPGDDAGVAFTGHAIVESMHGTGIPYVWNFTRDYLMSHGHAAVEVAVFPSTMERHMLEPQPDRYGDLQVTEEQTLEILAQVGRLLKSDQTPLPGVKWLLMTGHSMAAGPVWQYMDTRHEVYRLPGGGPVYDAFFPQTTRTASRMGPFPDVDVPTLVINSELEVEHVIVEGEIDYRKPDSDEPGEQFRLYEVAGMPHNSTWMHPYVRSLVEDTCEMPLNHFPYNEMTAMALDHLIRWVGEGVEPPRIDRIELEERDDGSVAVARDEHGNALGGVRTTHLDVPVAMYQALNYGEGRPGIGSCEVFGAQVNFSKEKLEELYGSHENYVDLVNQRLEELIDEGWFLSEFAYRILEEAQNFDGFQ